MPKHPVCEKTQTKVCIKCEQRWPVDVYRIVKHKTGRLSLDARCHRCIRLNEQRKYRNKHGGKRERKPHPLTKQVGRLCKEQRLHLSAIGKKLKLSANTIHYIIMINDFPKPPRYTPGSTVDMDRVKRIHEMLHEGLVYDQIGDALGLTRNSIAGYVYRHGLNDPNWVPSRTRTNGNYYSHKYRSKPSYRLKLQRMREVARLHLAL